MCNDLKSFVVEVPVPTVFSHYKFVVLNFDLRAEHAPASLEVEPDRISLHSHGNRRSIMTREYRPRIIPRKQRHCAGLTVGFKRSPERLVEMRNGNWE